MLSVDMNMMLRWKMQQDLCMWSFKWDTNSYGQSIGILVNISPASTGHFSPLNSSVSETEIDDE